jgi:acetylornithine deacetylase/succinyl-diaminopimelate desuccinylase family protein
MAIPTQVRSKVLDIIDGMQDEIVQTIVDVVRIPSVDPNYSGVDRPAVLGGETRANQYIGEIYRRMGCETEFIEVEPQRSNLVGVLKGAGGGRSLMFNGHIDVVPVGKAEDWKWGDPFSGRIDAGRIYGRGSTDMKSGIISQALAIDAIGRAGYRLAGDMILSSVCGEEVMDHQLGTTAVARRYKADAAIVSEPSAPPIPLAIVPATPGLLWMGLTVEGKSTHASVRDEFLRAGGKGSSIGVNAVEKGVYMLTQIQMLEQQWGITKSHPLFQPGHFTLHPGVIVGGPHGVLVPFVVSEFCSIEYAIWYPPQEKVEDIKKEIEEFITAAASLDPWLKAHPPKVEWKLWWPPAEVSADHPVVKAISQAHELAAASSAKYCGPAKVRGFCAVCDASFLNAEGIPAVVYGPGDILVAHAVDEFVEIEQVMIAAKAYALAAMDWCGLA